MTDLTSRFTALLRWSEKYTKTDMVYLVGSGSWFVLGTTASWAISLGTVLAFANLIPRETYGTYQYVLSIADIFGILVLSGIDTAVARAVAQGKEGSLFEGLRAKIRWGLLGGAGSILFGSYYLLQGNALLGWAFIIAGIAIPFWETPGLYVAYLYGKKRFDLNNLYEIGAQLIAAIATVLALYLSKNLLIILAAYLASWGIARTFFFFLTLRKLPPNTERDPGVVSYGKHLTTMSAASSLSSNVDSVLLWHFLGPAAVAVYIFAQSLPIRAASVFKMVNRIAFPKMAAQDLQVVQNTLPAKVLRLCGLAALGAGAYVIAAPFIFAWLFPQYLDAVPYTQILSLLIVLQPFSLFSSLLTAHAKQTLLYIYNFGVPLFRIVVFLLLIPPFHIMGAILALVLVKLFDSALLTALFYRA